MLVGRRGARVREELRLRDPWPAKHAGVSLRGLQFARIILLFLRGLHLARIMLTLILGLYPTRVILPVLSFMLLLVCTSCLRSDLGFIYT